MFFNISPSVFFNTHFRGVTADAACTPRQGPSYERRHLITRDTLTEMEMSLDARVDGLIPSPTPHNRFIRVACIVSRPGARPKPSGVLSRNAACLLAAKGE